MTRVELDQGLPPVEVRIRRGDSNEPTIEPFVSENGGKATVAKWWIASGLFLFVLACYVLTSPGRIDIIDGQIRFDVAYNWLRLGHPVVRDPWVGMILGVTGKNGAVYSFYGAPASVLSMPLLWLGMQFSPQNVALSHFLFSLTSPFLGAMLAAVLFLFYREMGISQRHALGWTLVSSFATMVWPLSCTTFDNAQHALFALTAMYLGFASFRRDSKKLALAAGLMAGILVLYQEYFLLTIPALAVSTVDWSGLMGRFRNELRSAARAGSTSWVWSVIAGLRIPLELIRTAFRERGEARSSWMRYLWFLGGVSAGVLVSFAYNDLRFGSFLDNGKMHALSQRHPVWGNPISGLPTLLVSPGKSIFLYSPPLILCILGIRLLWRRLPQVAIAIVGTSATLILFMSFYAGLGGDFCWGPRYLTVLVPLWAVVFPFVPIGRARRDFVFAVIALGLLVQTMAVLVEPQRFFFEHGLDDLFWAEDQWTYFKRSALLARVSELSSLSEGPPPTAHFLTSAPRSEWFTYAILGTPPDVPRAMSPVWMRKFKIFYLPRPWPLAMTWIRPAQRPINLGLWLWSLFSVALMGSGLIYRGFAAGHKSAIEADRRSS